MDARAASAKEVEAEGEAAADRAAAEAEAAVPPAGHCSAAVSAT